MLTPLPGLRARSENGCGNRSGSILLLAAVISLAIAALATSVLVSARQQVSVARGEQRNLQAELAAESALAYALRQLADDLDWNGEDVLPLGAGPFGGFRIERLDDRDDPLDIRLRLTGYDGSSVARLEAHIEAVDTPDPAEPLLFRLRMLRESYF